MTAPAGRDPRAHLAVRLGELVRGGAEILEHRPPMAAVVRRRQLPALAPSVVVSLLGIAGLLLLRDWAFVPAVAIGLATWIAKSRHPGEEHVLLVRVDEDGDLHEIELSRSPATRPRTA